MIVLPVTVAICAVSSDCVAVQSDEFRHLLPVVSVLMGCGSGVSSAKCCLVTSCCALLQLVVHHLMPSISFASGGDQVPFLQSLYSSPPQ